MASGFSSDQVEKAKEAIGILSSIINPVQDEQVRHVYLYFCYFNKINQRPCSSRSLSGNEPRPRSEGEHVVHVPRVAVASCGSC